MPRGSRLIPSEGCLHVMCRGNNRQYIFKSDQDLAYYYESLKELKEENRVEIYHYCLMSNHIHLIVHVNGESTLSKYMKQVNLKYFHYFKKQNKYVGHLWQDRFKGCIIDQDSYLLQCGKYIELNPVRARIVERPDDYKYSSYNYYGMGLEDKLIREDPIYESLSKTLKGRQEVYTDFVLSDEIKKRLGIEKFIGSGDFVKRQEAKFCIKNSRGKRGRPRKS